MIVAGTGLRPGAREYVQRTAAAQILHALAGGLMSAYRKILVAVDGSPAANKGLREATRLAREERARLVIVHIVNDFHAYYSMEGAGLTANLREQLRQAGRKILDKAQALARRQGVEANTVLREIYGGPAAPEIVREAKKQRADLIVLGTHGRRGMTRLVMGSDAEEVVRSSPVPVLLVRVGAR
jgi:nucleotide-binding universal stress UspA family protein